MHREPIYLLVTLNPGFLPAAAKAHPGTCVSFSSPKTWEEDFTRNYVHLLCCLPSSCNESLFSAVQVLGHYTAMLLLNRILNAFSGQEYQLYTSVLV